MEITYCVSEEDHQQRAVDVLIRRTGMSRMLSKKVRLYGTLLCNGKPHRMIDPVQSGDVLIARYPSSNLEKPLIKHHEMIDILYQDDWLLVTAKPPGIVTHPSRKQDLNALTSLLSPDILHPINRLDRDTSGIVLIGLNGHTHHMISQQQTQKFYLAILHGRLPFNTGLINAPIRRDPSSLIRREIHPDGVQAKTIWRTIDYNDQKDVSLVKFQLLTGRTHQLRLHSMACGCPIVGDTLYHRDRLPDELDLLAGRQMLHASQLCFQHPITGLPINVTAPVPPDMQTVLDYLDLKIV
ncbi:MAG: RluA family pseudouridine synthase [Eubacteriales bacterium]|jgi:23S rRNA pseudouridine1911/1915/1917 synthase|nr:RluA family pseudouridine synthase [Eubacteriales bacterium]